MSLPPIDKLFSLIDFLGVFVGALGGALAAVRDTRYRYDLVGVIGFDSQPFVIVPMGPMGQSRSYLD